MKKTKHVCVLFLCGLVAIIALFSINGCGKVVSEAASVVVVPTTTTTTTTTTSTATTSTTTTTDPGDSVTTDTVAPTFAGLSSATVNTSGRITLSWSAASDNITAVNDIQFLIYQGTASITDFSSPTYTTTSGSYIVTGLDASTTYYFVVRAKDEAANIDTNTEEKSGTTNALLATPMLIRYLDDALTLDTTPTLSWSTVAGAASYEVQIDDNSDFSSVTVSSTAAATSYTSSSLNNSTYYWRVRANDGDNGGSWSLTRRLVVGKLAGDVNGDGFADVIVGAWKAASGGGVGTVYIFYGGASMSANIAAGSADTTLTAGNDNDALGYSVSSAGDINGDGYADVIVGDPLADTDGNNNGEAYIFFGGDPMDTTADGTITGGTAGDQLGFSVSAAGDVNGDGFADVIVGANKVAGGGTARGTAYVFFGASGATLDTTADGTITGGTDSDELGRSVSSAGDVNGDGYADIIVGAQYADGDGTNKGEAYVFYGASGSTLDTTTDITITGGTDNDELGCSVSSARDVNGDGYADLIIGAFTADGGGTDKGEAYVYYGGSSLGSTLTASDADVTITGGADSDQLGISVSSIGDATGDGLADMIVGADLANGSGSNMGQAYVFFGNASLSSTLTAGDADVSITGAADDDELGASVSSAGDTNGDTFDDAIVGAWEADGGARQGKAYIFNGGASMNDTVDVTLSGTAASRFGFSVSGGNK
ncbi:beta strand repeat-containing protein [Candidatus Margulisiibacteriota bacterium]